LNFIRKIFSNSLLPKNYRQLSRVSLHQHTNFRNQFGNSFIRQVSDEFSIAGGEFEALLLKITNSLLYNNYARLSNLYKQLSKAYEALSKE
jgi:hypothetical protein